MELRTWGGWQVAGEWQPLFGISSDPELHGPHGRALDAFAEAPCRPGSLPNQSPSLGFEGSQPLSVELTGSDFGSGPTSPTPPSAGSSLHVTPSSTGSPPRPWRSTTRDRGPCLRGGRQRRRGRSSPPSGFLACHEPHRGQLGESGHRRCRTPLHHDLGGAGHPLHRIDLML